MVKSHILPPHQSTITQAVDRLKKGQLVVFPTETVYGLGADALNQEAVKRIFHTKRRPSSNPLIAHVADIDMMKNHVDISEQTVRLSQAFWPGPLTLILPLKANHPFPKNVTAGLNSIGVRIPDHKVALSLLQSFQGPIVAPSANASGQTSPTCPEHVVTSLPQEPLFILDAGACKVGIESTILDMTSTPCILRPGIITREEISEILGHELASPNPHSPIKSPGLFKRHYAPQKTLRLNAITPKKNETLLAFGPQCKTQGFSKVLWLSESGDMKQAANRLFDLLHQADQHETQSIAVSPIPHKNEGEALNDRLKRASTPADSLLEQGDVL